MVLQISFSSKLDNINDLSTIRIREYYDLDEYAYFNIKIKIEKSTFLFSSAVLLITDFIIDEFLRNFRNKQHSKISFNNDYGSSIIYNPQENNIYFNVFTYKEGTVTNSDYEIEINDNDHLIFIDIFQKLLNFKNLVDSIEYEEDSNFSDSEISDIEAQPQDDDTEDEQNDS